ncbi:MAG: hypothetical protein GYB66_10950, partial [Chloroflexi bacterium]|nr:hypothetical protein [Chloroflexota bacterium]
MLRIKRILAPVGLIVLLAILGTAGAAPPAQSPPIPIGYGQSAEGTIDASQPAVSYVFDATSGDSVLATVIPLGSELDPKLDLSTFDGTLLVSDDNSGEDNGARITYVIPADGAYLLTVAASEESDTSGAFLLVLDEGVAVPTSTPTPEPTIAATPTPTPTLDTSQIVETEERLQRIRPGTRVQGTLEGEVNFNLYWFSGRAEQQISLIPEAGTGFQPLMVLYQSDFTEIFRSQPGETLTATLPTDDIYFITAAVRDVGTGGTYQFTLNERRSAPASGGAGDVDGMIYGDSYTGTISNINPTVRQRFRGLAGDTITLSMAAVSGDLDSYLLLVDASGTTLAEDDNSGNNTDAQLTVELPTDGEYFIIATRRGQEQGVTAGDFVLTLTSDAPPRGISNSTPDLPEDYEGLPQIRYGETTQESINNAAFVDFYVFYGNAGDTVDITMEAVDTLDPFLILLDENRIPLSEHDDISDNNKNAQINFTLPTDGYYAIVATRFDQEAGLTSGEYTLSLSLDEAETGDSTLESQVAALPATRIVSGEAPSGDFDPLRFATVYRFTAAEGTLNDFAVTADGGTIATVIMTDSQLNVVATSNNGILLSVNAPRSGDYLVFVMPQAGPAANVTGSYIAALNAESGDSAATTEGGEVPIAYGTTVRGRITEDQTEIRYIFQGNAGDLVEIAMNAEAAAQPLDTYLILEDAEGNILAENDDITPGTVRDSFIFAELPEDGEYTIIATRYSGDTAPLTTGSFTLALQYQDPAVAGVNREALTIFYGQPLTETINENLNIHFFYFQGEQGDTVGIEVSTIDGTLDPIAYLYAITSTDEFFLLSANDDDPRGGSYNSYIEYTLPRTGGYVIAVTRYAEVAAEPTTGTF